jgi:hypothetical protein
MIRRVAFKKAIFAGVLGAVAWEAAARLISLTGWRIFDIVHVLGTMIFGQHAPAWNWWVSGLAMHCLVGAIWAIFYAYFFWSTFDYRPMVQGIIFSLLPAVLAGLVMVPQLDLMRPGILSNPGPFAISLGAGGPLMIVLGHLIYGTVLGTLYVRPVGYPVGKRISLHA